MDCVRNTELSTSGKYELDRLIRYVEQQKCAGVNVDSDASVHDFNQLQVNSSELLGFGKAVGPIVCVCLSVSVSLHPVNQLT